MDGSLLYEGAKAGDVVRAEAEFDLEGISVVSVEPPRVPEQADPNRIELVGRPTAPLVTTEIARGRDRDRPGLNGRSDRRRSTQPGLAPAGPPAPHDGRQGTRDRPPKARHDQPAAPGDRRPRIERRQPHREVPEQLERAARPTAGPGRTGPGRASHGPHEDAAATDRRTTARWPGDGSALPARRAKRLNPGNAHRTAMLEGLPPEQRPVAQQLLRGGIPAVRTALHFERERARDEGRPEPSTEGVLALAESLLSRVKAAEWRDRAEAAIKAGDDLSMRDLRSLVSGSDVARDEPSRELAVALRSMLERRVEEQWAEWQAKVTAELDAGHVAKALRLSSRPPEISARFPADLATRLRDAASAAMSAGTPPDQWLSLLQAVVDSPVRRTVKPAGLPHNPSSDLLEAARQQCGRVPALAPLLGISIPPPPGPSRPGPTRRAFGTPARTRARSTSRPAAPADVAPSTSAQVTITAQDAITAPTDGQAEPTPMVAESSVAPMVAESSVDAIDASSGDQSPAPPGDDAQPVSVQVAPDAEQ